MESLVVLALAVLSMPFLLPVVSLVAGRRLRRRVEALEEDLRGQAEVVRELKAVVTRLSNDASRRADTVVGPAAERQQAVAAELPEPPRPAPPVVVVPAEPPLPPPAVQRPPVLTRSSPLATPAPAPPPELPSSADVARERPRTPFDPTDVSSLREVVPPAPDLPPPPRRRPPLPPPPPVPPPSRGSFDWERLVGVRLFSAIAGIALVFAAVLFLRYSIDHGWLSPPVRVAIGIATGLALLVVCELRAARRYPVTANALDAAAVAILFATFFAAHALYELIPAWAAFALLALVTATAVLLSIRRESLFIAILGLLGGFATPALLSTGENRPVPLFAYLLLLNVGLAWVARTRGWPILGLLTLVLTTLYQWAWVVKFLAESPLPLALGVFVVFPIVAVAAHVFARGRADSNARAAGSAFERTTVSWALLPLVFAGYLAVVPAYGARYELLFGYLFLLDAGLLVLAIALERELLHATAAAATLVVFAGWCASGMPADAWIGACGFAALFVGFYLAAPAIARWFGCAFDDEARHAELVAPTLLFVFSVVVHQASLVSPAGPFAVLFVLLILVAWRAIAIDSGPLYFIAAFFAIAAQVVWSVARLDLDSLRAGLLLYAVFGLTALAVPVVARRSGSPLRPAAGGGLVLLASLAMLLFLTNGATAGPSLWGLGVLLAILNGAVFIESAATSMPLVSLAAGGLSWVVLLRWWTRAAGAVGLLPSLLLVLGLGLLMLGGHAWARRASADRAVPAAARGRRFGQGLWLGLVADLFLLVVAASTAWALPPWPLFGALAVMTLATSTAALAEMDATLHGAGVVAAAIVLFTLSTTAQPVGWGGVELGAFVGLVAFATGWTVVTRRAGLDRASALAAAVTTAVSVLGVLSLSMSAHAPDQSAAVAVQVAFICVLLALGARAGWPFAATLTSVLAGLVLLVRFGGDGAWQDMLRHALPMYVPFAAYPLIVSRRAPGSRDPYVAAIVASAWCFLAVRYGVDTAGYGAIVGVVPIGLGAITLLHLRSLLRLEPPGARDLGRLALVAGAALAFLTVAIPLQLHEQWFTIGWALEAAAVAWLYRRVPHRGLLLASGTLVLAVFARLALNPEVFRYEPRGDTPILNWYLYTYVLAAAAMFAVAWWLWSTADRPWTGWPRVSVAAMTGGTVLLFLLLNIEIADYYATGPEIVFRFGASIAQDLTYTIGWLAFGVVLLACGILGRSHAARVAALVLLTVTTFKCFLYDLSSLGGLYRVGAFVGLAVSLALVSLALQKFVLAPGKEASR